MKQFSLCPAVVISSLLVSAASYADELRPLDDLGQWNYDPALWEVNDGVATGRTVADPQLPYNKFLVWNGGTLTDFELTVKLKVTGDNNSGIQYRSQQRPDLGDYVMSGYQCDVHTNNDYCAMLYEERGRGIIATRGQKIAITKDGEKKVVGKVGKPAEVNIADWNTYEIRAEGNHLIHKLNGIVTVEIIDLDEAHRALSGLLAFQVHRGPAMEVQIKDLVIKRLPPGKLLTEADVPVPQNKTNS